MLNETDLVKEMENLRRFALKLCKNSSDADDLLQETLLKALDHKDRFVSDTSAFKWTSKIMFNTFVTAYRRKAKFETQYDPEIFMDVPLLEASQETRMEVSEVGMAIETMSDEHKSVLLMVCVQGMQYQEVAEVLNLPIGTVRSRLSRAREQLQYILNHSDKHIPQNYLSQTSSAMQMAS